MASVNSHSESYEFTDALRLTVEKTKRKFCKINKNMSEQIVQYDGCKYSCYGKKGKTRTGKDSFRVFCRRVDSKCVVGKLASVERAVTPPRLKVELPQPKQQKEYYEMNTSEFIDNYDLRPGDKVYCLARYCTSDEQPNLPRGISGNDVVEAEIMQIVPGKPPFHHDIAIINCLDLLKQERKEGPPTPNMRQKIAGRSGAAPIPECGYGAMHKKFITAAMQQGKAIPLKVLQEYPELKQISLFGQILWRERKDVGFAVIFMHRDLRLRRKSFRV